MSGPTSSTRHLFRTCPSHWQMSRTAHAQTSRAVWSSF